MTATFSSVSADAGPVHKSAGSYTVAPPVLSGPPTTENGVTFIAGTVDVTTIGAQTGVAAVDFSCTLDTGARGVNECKGSFLFDGTIHGKTGTYRADLFDWTASGEDAFTPAKFQMVRGERNRWILLPHHDWRRPPPPRSCGNGRSPCRRARIRSNRDSAQHSH